MVMGSQLNVSPLTIVIAVMRWVSILGAPGPLLAVRLTVGLVMVIEAVPTERGVAGQLRNKVERTRENIV